jgi:hypothetical protein
MLIIIIIKIDVTVEGIFRKNGNIRRMSEQIEAMNRNPNSVKLNEENPVQLAALLKRFLRDLPEPLLTFKLHRMFTTSQRKFDIIITLYGLFSSIDNNYTSYDRH